MAVTTDSFRADFPEFGDPLSFTKAHIDFWLSNASLFLDSTRWGSWFDLGSELFAAHHISIEIRAQQEASTGQSPGAATGVINSKSVDKISVGFDTALSAEEGGGHWNLTIYGTRYLRMAKQIGSGPIHIGADYTTGFAGAYSYPWYTLPNPSM